MRLQVVDRVQRAESVHVIDISSVEEGQGKGSVSKRDISTKSAKRLAKEGPILEPVATPHFCQ